MLCPCSPTLSPVCLFRLQALRYCSQNFQEGAVIFVLFNLKRAQHTGFQWAIEQPYHYATSACVKSSLKHRSAAVRLQLLPISSYRGRQRDQESLMNVLYHTLTFNDSIHKKKWLYQVLSVTARDRCKAMRDPSEN